jgi:hypothetical protein
LGYFFLKGKFVKGNFVKGNFVKGNFLKGIFFYSHFDFFNVFLLSILVVFEAFVCFCGEFVWCDSIFGDILKNLVWAFFV